MWLITHIRNAIWDPHVKTTKSVQRSDWQRLRENFCQKNQNWIWSSFWINSNYSNYQDLSSPARNWGRLMLLLSGSVASDSLPPHGLQHAGSPVLHHLWAHWISDAIQPSHPVTPVSCHLQSCPASGSFTVSQLFISGGQRTGASALASVLPMNIQGWFP